MMGPLSREDRLAKPRVCGSYPSLPPTPRLEPCSPPLTLARGPNISKVAEYWLSLCPLFLCALAPVRGGDLSLFLTSGEAGALTIILFALETVLAVPTARTLRRCCYYWIISVMLQFFTTVVRGWGALAIMREDTNF